MIFVMQVKYYAYKEDFKIRSLYNNFVSYLISKSNVFIKRKCVFCFSLILFREGLLN